jgi:hypothetical protein
MEARIEWSRFFDIMRFLAALGMTKLFVVGREGKWRAKPPNSPLLFTENEPVIPSGARNRKILIM